MAIIIDIGYFEKLWKQPEADLAAVQKLWDYRAGEFNQHKKRAEGKRKIENLINFLQSHHMLHQNSEVLDIGCGAGNYALDIAKSAKAVVGIDISPNMIKHAKENALRAGVNNVDFIVSPWETLNLKEKGWAKKFDLVFASMCPGINSKASLLKMVEASRGFCFLSSFARREDSVKDALYSIVYGQKPNSQWSKKVYCIFNILWLLGYYPSICYHDTQWIQQWELEKAIEYYSVRLAKGGKLSPTQSQKMEDYLQKIAQDQVISEKVTARVAWLYWQV